MPIERLKAELASEQAAHTRTMDNAARRLVSSNAEIADLRERLANAEALFTIHQQDALRFRFLCDDIKDPALRAARNELLVRMASMSYSAVCIEIDRMVIESGCAA